MKKHIVGKTMNTSLFRHGQLQYRRSASGFTLIEVLVAILILGIGILGMAGMQAMSVRESQNTYFRTQADMLAYDIVDRMRANRGEAATTAAYVSDGSAPGSVGACAM